MIKDFIMDSYKITILYIGKNIIQTYTFDIFVFDIHRKMNYKIFFFTSKIPKTFHNGHV